ncbi:MAG: hypothetical protein II949_12020 [Prevotella sp.]|nr:hypothetical protein [Prevotella sp.]
MKKRLLMQLLAVGFAMSSFAAYNVGDYIYSSTAKYRIDGENLITNGDFTVGDGTEGWTNELGETIDGATWGIETAAGPNGENAIKSLGASAEEGKMLHNVWQLQPGFYTVSYWVKSPEVAASSVADGGTNYVNFFLNDTGDNTITTAVAAAAPMMTEWNQVVMTVEIPAESYLVFLANNVATDVLFTGFEIHQAVEVYDTRIAERYINQVDKLLNEPDFADKAGDVLGMLDMLKEALAAQPEDGTELTSLIEEFDIQYQMFLDQVAGNAIGTNVDGTAITRYLTDWSTWGYYNWNNMTTRNTWTFEGGRWGFSPNDESLERPADDGYVASAGIQTSYDLTDVGVRIADGAFNNTSIKSGRFMFSIEAQAVSASNKAAPYGANTSVVIAGPRMWMGDRENPVVFENDTLSNFYWKTFYIIGDIYEGGNVQAGFTFPNIEGGKGGRYSLRNPQFRIIGMSQEQVDHLYAFDQLVVQKNALKQRLDSANMINAYTQAAGYPWGHSTLQAAIDNYTSVYSALLSVVDENGNEVNPGGVSLEYKDEILEAVRQMNSAINAFYSTNRAYQTLVADLAKCNASLNAPKNASGDKATFKTVIDEAQGMVNNTTTDADEVDAFNEMDDRLLTAKEEFEKSSASRANPANLYVKGKNLNFESWTSKSTYSSDRTVNGWNITIGADGKQWDIQPYAGYEFGHRASIWRGSSVGPNGRMQQTITLTTPGVYEFRSRAFSAEYGDGAKWDQYMAIANICGSDLDEALWIDTPVDTVYHPNVRIFFGPEGAVNDSVTLTKCAPADYLRNTETDALVYTRETGMNYSVIYVKNSADPETVEFGLEAFENGASAGACTFGFGDNRLYYLGATDKYTADTDADYNAQVQRAKDMIAQYGRYHETVGWIVVKLMRLVGDSEYPWAEGLSYVAPTTLQEKQNVYLTIREYIDMLRYTLDPSLVAAESGIQEIATAAEKLNIKRQGTFNLNGMRMDGKSLPAGLYIINGKKVLVK